MYSSFKRGYITYDLQAESGSLVSYISRLLCTLSLVGISYVLLVWIQYVKVKDERRFTYSPRIIVRGLLLPKIKFVPSHNVDRNQHKKIQLLRAFS